VPRLKPIAALLILLLLAPLARTSAQTQPAGLAPRPGVVPYRLQYDTHITVRADRSASSLSTRRFKILSPTAIGPVSQQQIISIEGMQSVDIIEAYTEKADGRRIAVDPANIITRDAASGQQAVFVKDLKQRTLLFPDVQVGDTVVITQRINTQHGVFPGQFMHADVFARSQPISAAKVVVERRGSSRCSRWGRSGPA
jgi:hypothetical protein